MKKGAYGFLLTFFGILIIFGFVFAYYNESSVTGNVVVSQRLVCSDSDSGNNYYVLGEVNLSVFDSVHRSYKDYCQDEKTLIEYRCAYSYGKVAGRTQVAVKYRCPRGCLDGTCVKK